MKINEKTNCPLSSISFIPATNVPSAYETPTFCSAIDGNGAEVHIWVRTYQQQMLQEILESCDKQNFEAMYNVKIKVTAIKAEDWDIQLDMAIAAGKTPNIILDDDLRIDRLLQGGILLEITDYLANAGICASNFADYNIKSVERDGKIMALPFSNNPTALYYNKSLFEIAGLDRNIFEELYQNGQFTWDAFLGIARSIKGSSGIHMMPYMPDGRLEMIMAGIKGEKIHCSQSVYFDDNIILEIMNLMNAFLTEGLLLKLENTNSLEEKRKAVINGEVAAVIGGLEWAKIISQNNYGGEEWGIIPLPAFIPGHNPNHINSGSNSWMVLTGHNDPIITQIATKFLLSFAANYNLITALARNHGIIPALMDAIDNLVSDGDEGVFSDTFGENAMLQTQTLNHCRTYSLI